MSNKLKIFQEIAIFGYVIIKPLYVYANDNKICNCESMEQIVRLLIS